MQVLEFGNRNKPGIVLIHGAFVSYTMWNRLIDLLKDDFCVLVPILDGHAYSKESTFSSVEEEASRIIECIKKENFENLKAMIGCSLGGVIAVEIITRQELNIEKAIIDGAYLTTVNEKICKIYAKIVVKIFNSLRREKSIIKSILSKRLPEKTVNALKESLDQMTEEACFNIAFSNYKYQIKDSISQSNTSMAYWYGEKEKGLLRKSVKRLRELLPRIECEEMKGMGHGGLLSNDPVVYFEKVMSFLNK